MIILMQEQFRTRHEFGPTDCQEDSVGARCRKHAAMKLRVERALDHDYSVHRLLEHLLKCLGDCLRKHVPSSDLSTPPHVSTTEPFESRQYSPIHFGGNANFKI